MAENVVTVRYFAGAKAASGTAEETARAADLAGLKTILAERHGYELERVLKVSTLLVDGLAARDEDAPLAEGATVEVLPPFAGG
ncbi:MoaD/ThiS family protein [Glycomyces tenuis]|uniref:MoaD/ThiS family protein n=1 Tax=Glycomyces tenuis TaxID=58116 RepID=UPI00041AF936|nr:MoaD/ThiS family protein [Glycomyces tenuis]